MKLNFTKMNGAGNDFIVFSDRNFKPLTEIIKKLCDRHFGIGADGVVWVQESDSADFKIRYFNSDGTGDTLCINGARCAVLYAFLNNFSKKQCTFEFVGKIFKAEILNVNEIKIWLDYQPVIELKKSIEFRLKKFETAFFDLGSKHIIIDWNYYASNFQDETRAKNFNDFDIISIGRELRYHQEFIPDGVNVNFIQKLENNLYALRTYERGVEGETLACGSGSICAALYGYLNERINPPVYIKTRGGKILTIFFEVAENEIKNIQLTGPAEKVFEGIIEL